MLSTPSYPVNVIRKCRYSQANQSPPAGKVLFVESFEQAHTVSLNGWTVLGQAKNGASWNNWSTQDAGIEINGIPTLSGGTIRFGNFFAELDSHCYVTGCNSNSTMFRTLNLTPGEYELRYWYISRIKNSNSSWSNLVACGSKDSDPKVAPIDHGIMKQIELKFMWRKKIIIIFYPSPWLMSAFIQTNGLSASLK